MIGNHARAALGQVAVPEFSPDFLGVGVHAQDHLHARAGHRLVTQVDEQAVSVHADAATIALAAALVMQEPSPMLTGVLRAGHYEAPSPADTAVNPLHGMDVVVGHATYGDLSAFPHGLASRREGAARVGARG
jgi:hypothetical protein